MPRPRQRVCLNQGLKLDINVLARQGLVQRGSQTAARRIIWTHDYWGEVATCTISADLSGQGTGWVRVELNSGWDQTIITVARSRPYGGRQWYFQCRSTNTLASVIWRPNGATYFASRKAFGRKVA